MIDALIQEGWSYHDSKPEQLAGELEGIAGDVGDAQLIAFLNLSNHTIGDHLGDWERARSIAEKVVSNTPKKALNSRVGSFLAVARFMGGDPPGAQQAELLGVDASDSDALYALLDTKMLISKALVFSDRFEEGCGLYRSVMDVISQIEDAMPVDRSFAITSNNIATELLGKSERNESVSDLMRMSARQSLRFWKKCGTWENEERGLYLLAQVENELQQYDEAIAYVDQALAILSRNGGEPVDEAFIRLAAAQAHLNLASEKNYVMELKKADELAASWNDEALLSWYQDERAKLVG